MTCIVRTRFFHFKEFQLRTGQPLFILCLVLGLLLIGLALLHLAVLMLWQLSVFLTAPIGFKDSRAPSDGILGIVFLADPLMVVVWCVGIGLLYLAVAIARRADGTGA